MGYTDKHYTEVRKAQQKLMRHTVNLKLAHT